MSDPTPPLSSTLEFQRPIEVFVVQPYRPRYWLHILLLLATFFTMLVVGARMQFNFVNHLPTFYDGDNSLSIFPIVWALRESHLLLGLPFALTLLLILLAHEMGHYVYCRTYAVSATLPFFIPFPTLFGTMGAFIRIRSSIRSRNALFDIGIAGPIAGFLVAVAMLAISLGLSQTSPTTVHPASIEFGHPIIFHVVRWLLAAAAPAHSVATLPFSHVYLHPMAMAAWIGMFATALNLLPGGQLDGGHIIFAVAPRAHRWVTRLAILALIPLGIYAWAGWLIWAVLLGLSGLRHPVVPESPGLDRNRFWLACVALLMLALTFTPTPVIDSSLMSVISAWRNGR